MPYGQSDQGYRQINVGTVPTLHKLIITNLVVSGKCFVHGEVYTSEN